MSCNSYNNITANGSVGKQTVNQLLDNITPLQEIESKQSSFTAKFDQEQTLKAVIAVNNFFTNLIPSELNAYPALQDRVSNSIISPLELTQFAYTFNYQMVDILNNLPPSSSIIVDNGIQTPISIPTASRSIVANMDYFYQKNISSSVMGGVCSYFSDNFAQVMYTFNTIQSLLNGDISQITGLFGLVKSLIDKIFSLGIGLLQNVGTTIAKISNSNAFSYIAQKLLAVQSLFTDLNKQLLNTTLEGMISSMAGQFKSITGDVLAYILFKICQISSSIENFLMNPVQALTASVTGYQTKTMPLETLSNTNQATAISFGATRLSQNAIILGRSQIATSINSQNTSFSGVNPAQYITTPADDFERSLVVNMTENGNQFIQFSSSVKNMEKIHPSSNPANNIPGAGWRKVHPDAYIKIFRVAERLGIKLQVNSAYRNENYNASVGGKSRSLHMSGMALDISMNGINPREFIKYASQEGFTGIGTYPTFVHVDIGSRRTWGTLYSDALQLHTQDRFRKG